MNELQKPQIILTHESDLDGLVSGCLLKRLAQHLFGEDVPLAAYHLAPWQSRQMLEHVAWVSDLSMEARLDREGWLVVDHHPAKHQPTKARYHFDSQQCAASLAYQLLQEHGLGNPQLDVLVHLTRVADLFLESDADFERACDHAELVKAYHFHPLMKLLEGKLEDLLDHPLLEVIQVKRRVEDPMGLEWALRHTQPVAPGVTHVELCLGNQNLIMNQLLKDPAMEDQVLLSIGRRAPNQYGVSLRSRNGKAGEVAGRLMGGGHPNAAGATLPKSVKSFQAGMDYITQQLQPALPQPPQSGLEDLESALGEL